jgi:hypothetical protein
MKTLLALIGATLIAGCAGGGGSDAEIQLPPDGPPPLDWRTECAGFVGIYSGIECESYLKQRQAWVNLDWQADKFKSWSTQTGVQTVRANGASTLYTATSGVVDTASYSYLAYPYVDVEYSASAGEPYELSLRDYRKYSDILGNYSIVNMREDQGYEVRYPFLERPGFVAMTSNSAEASAEKNVFVEGASGAMVLAVNPNTLGWNYQSFGVWDVEIKGKRYVDALTFGAPSLATAVPTAGNATFNGVLGGLYISPAGQGSLASANLRVDVDFSTRTVGFASTATTLTRDLSTSTVTSAPSLDLSGTLHYYVGTASFRGSLVNAGGTLSGVSEGRFYGPTAQELGGSFQVHAASGVETFTGAYGAKR